MSAAAGAWVQCSSGSSYCFSVYSPLLKASQSYSQSTLDSVAFFKDVGANVGVLSGLLQSSRGPSAVLAAGAAQCLAGYLLIWASVAGVLPRPPPALMCVYMLLAAQAQTFFNTADVVTAVENFPGYRGTVIGIMKGFLGLSGAILIQIYRTLFNGNPSSFLLMLALVPSILPLVMMYFIRVYPDANGEDDGRGLDAFSLIAMTTAAYLMIVIIGEAVFTLGLPVRILALVVLLMLLVSPLAVVYKAQVRESSKTQVDETSSCHDTERITYPKQLASTDCDQEILLLLPREESLNLLQAMRTCNFWLLFVAMACGMGSGLATVNNMGQIGSSLGYTSRATSTLVSLWSIWNFLGRFGSGYISDYMLRLHGWARPLFIVITLGVMSVGHVIISSDLPGSLYVGSVLVGVCYGSQWALMPSITSELFGLRHFGTIFNSIAIASPVGSYILSVKVVGSIYDSEASSTGVCTGRNCFMLSFLIMASFALLGVGVSLALFLRTRRFYKQVILARVRHSALQ